MKKLLKRKLKKLTSFILAFGMGLSGATFVHAGRGETGDDAQVPYFITKCEQYHAVNLGSLDRNECVRRCDENFQSILQDLDASAYEIIDYDSYEKIFLAIEIVCVVHSAEDIDLVQSMLSDLRKFESRSIILRELFVGTNELWVRKPLYRLRNGGVSEVIRISSPQISSPQIPSPRL